MKKILSMVLAMSIVFGTAAPYVAVAADSSAVSAKTDYQAGDYFTEGDLGYTVLEDGTLQVVWIVNSSLTVVDIPSSVNGMAVTSINGKAFEYDNNLISVTIPGSVKSIGYEAFINCRNLASVTISDGVTSIGERAFWCCENLTTMTLPDSVTSIGGGAFGCCLSLSSIEVPANVTEIADAAFCYCTSLSSVTIPASVTSISSGVFSGCESLTSINVNSKNKFYCSEDGILFNKDKTELILYPIGKTSKSYTIPNSVTSIVHGAFSDCTNLTMVTIPEGVTSIEGATFFGCTNLASVTIPDSVTSIEVGAFFDCASLTTVTIPDSVTSIGDMAFIGCTSLITVTIPDSVTSIGGQAFGRCEKLKDVYYSGTEEEWGKINIDEFNEPLTAATIHYNSTGPALSSVQIDIAKPTSGNIPDTSGMKVEVVGDGEKPQTITISADGKLDLSGIADGKYSFTFSANNCAPRKYSVTVLNGTASGIDSSVELHLYGDVNGDRKINGTDVLKAKLHAKGSQKLSGYDLSVADVTKDGKINGTDVLKLKLHAKGSTKLW